MTRRNPQRAVIGGTGTWYPDDDTTVTFEFRYGPAGVQVTRFTAWANDGGPIPAETQRAIGAGLRAAAEYWYGRAMAEYEASVQAGPGTVTLGEGEDAISFQVARLTVRQPGNPERADEIRAEVSSRRRRHSVNDPRRLRTAAEAYLANPVAPTNAVAAALRISKPQASRYVRAAREAGLIPPLDRK